MGIWENPWIIIEPDGTERPASALEQAWIERFKAHHTQDESKKFHKSGSTMFGLHYKCADCGAKV